MRRITVYTDYKSPYAYLAKDLEYELKRDFPVRLEWRPYVLDIPSFLGSARLDAEGHVLEAERNAHQWRRVRYSYMDCRRQARKRGLVIRGPQKIFDSRLSLISGLYADDHGKFRPYSDRVFERFFRRELNIEDSHALEAVMAEVELDPADFRRYAASEGPSAFARARDQAEQDKVFGVPTLIVDGEPFWGNDRVDWVVKKLDSMGLRR